MRLFELEDPNDARAILSIIQGLANHRNVPEKMPFQTFKNLIDGDSIGIGTPKALVDFKNTVDPTGDVIKSIEDEGDGNVYIILNTRNKGQVDASASSGGDGPGIGAMASKAAKYKPVGS